MLYETNREDLNYKFALVAIDVKIYNYVKNQNTQLNVLSNIEIIKESVVEINQYVVNNRSVKLSNSDVAVEKKEIVDLNTNHKNIARFNKEKSLRDLYIDEIVFFLESFSAEERVAYDNLTNSILKDLKIDIHQFYQLDDRKKSASIKILSEHLSLKDFFDFEPSECLRRRLMTSKKNQSLANDNSKSAIKIRHSSESENSIIKMTPPSFTNDDDKGALSFIQFDLSLTASTPQTSESRHTRPSLKSTIRRASLIVEDIPLRQPQPVIPRETLIHESDGADTKSNVIQYNDHDRRPQRSYTFQLSSDTSNLFKWIHIPWNHTG